MGAQGGWLTSAGRCHSLLKDRRVSLIPLFVKKSSITK